MVLRETFSVCPVCLARIPARRIQEGQEVFLEKTCPGHGVFRTILWRGHGDPEAWIGPEGDPLQDPHCPDACGLCPDHRQKTCCVQLEVTRRCDLGCRHCLAGGGQDLEPSLAQLKEDLAALTEPGKTLVQLTGGEPTLRDDLPELVAAAKAAGCRYVQLNSNGIRLGEDAGYARALAEAGLSFVFMQFDGTEEAIHEALRGRPLLALKQRAIAHCAAANVGVTLVPTLVPGVNTHNLGDLLRFGIRQAPAVRGIHFQPVTHLGRVPALPTDEARFTLDQLLHDLVRQSDGLLAVGNLVPSACDHPLCGFHGDFIVTPEGKLMPLSRRKAGGCCAPATAEQNRLFVARRWERPKEYGPVSCCTDLHDMDAFLGRVKSHGFTLTAMAFQDAGNLDLERLRRCSLHVYDRGRFVPFCAHHLTALA
ncbi:MAG TPA: radical SAM protein [Holophaga sp.]|nr:radical SAM protein [Holophaga sp.]